ncbi:MAG: hypothetical protein L6Q33_15335 [Bacteriovoracaceae bacterium]|nr:hypothetical protein [Bacteriovoracaceae bacterium]
MSRDDFQDVLINQYRDVVEELVIESESVYRSQLDYELLSSRVSNLIKAAKVDGLDEQVIWKILERRVPDFVQIMQSGTPSRRLKLVA